MTSSSALSRARRAYERAAIGAGARGIAVAAALCALAIALHHIAKPTFWLVAGSLAITLAFLGWRGGAWRRGSLAGVLAGLPPLIAPSLVFAFGHGGHCPDCEMGPTAACLITCFGTSALVGVFVGYRACIDMAPRRFAAGALVSATMTGLLGCGTTGLGGAAGIAIGLVAGGAAGWVFAERPSRA